jgi:hypothetical protein
MPLIPGFPDELNDLHHAWHQPAAHPGLPTRVHLPPSPGSGLEFLQFHHDLIVRFHKWFDLQPFANQFDVAPWTSIPADLKQRQFGWNMNFANQETRIVLNNPAFATEDELGLFIEQGLHNQFLHTATSQRFNEPIVGTLHSPQSTLFYKIHGLVDYWWNQWKLIKWAGSTCMAACGDRLYIIQGAYMVRTNPLDGSWEVIWQGKASSRLP